MIEVTYQRAVFLPGIDLWMDPRERKARAFVSHAHSDHSGIHDLTLASPVTLRLMEARMGTLPGEKVALPFGETRSFDTFSIRLLPAGHVLGSAQGYLESAEGSLLYTGDFKLRRGASAEAAEFCHAETLIMETTFGLPRYVFPPLAEVLGGIRRFCIEALEEGAVPVLACYSLGKSQEILMLLRGEGFPMMVHRSVAGLLEIYAAEGIVLPDFAPWSPEAAAGHVLICPPAVAASAALAKSGKRRVAAITGWAMDPGAIHRLRCDAAFPLSDHAGYDDLLRHVENVRPCRVLTLHGFAVEFARDLRERGIEAWALTAPNQLELTLPGVKAEPDTVSTSSQPGVEPRRFLRWAATASLVAGLTGRNAKIARLAEYFGTLDPDELAIAVRWFSGRVFPASEDVAHGVGWAVIRRALKLASGMAEADLRAISRRFRDAGLTTGGVMAGRDGAEDPPLPEVMERFRSIRDLRGPLRKADLLTAMFRSLPAAGSAALVKILSGDLRIGLKEGLVEEAVAVATGQDAAAVRDANMLLGDLGGTALLASEGRLSDAGLRLFHPIRSMLASPEPSAEAVVAHFCGSLWIEEKFDGIRAQVHASGGRVEIFSRELRSITPVFPELVASAGRLAGELVLDGEVVAWAGGRPASFFELQKRLGRAGGDLFLGAEIPVVFVAFDLLRLNGRTLVGEPLRERRKALERLDWQEPFRLARVSRPESAAEVDAAFDASREAGFEGLLAKDPESRYQPGRRGGAWVKLKKRFATLDVVVTAVQYGHGRRRDVLSDYTFAVRDSATGALANIGKAYSGLTDAEIAERTGYFLSRVTKRTGALLEVVPELILEVAFDAIRRSPRHASGLALRFPRIVRIRTDKTVAEIDTIDSAARLIVD